MKEIFDLLREEIKSKKARTDNKCKELLESEGYSPDYRFFEGKSVGLRIATEQLDKAEAKWEEDCCEWKLILGNTFVVAVSHENEVFTQTDMKFCPYCGKRIKLAEVE